METIFEARDVRVSFGGREVVHGASISATGGSVVALLGPNGAGKSTTLRAALGLVKASGEFTIHGRLGILLDDGGLIPGLTGRQHLHAVALQSGIPVGNVQNVLERVQMASRCDRKIKTYSLGMKRRIALAAALLRDPEILILDEPSSGLDPEGIRWLGTMIRSFADKGGAVIVATHHLAEAAAIADNVVIIADGHTTYSGSLAELGAGQTLETAYFNSLGAMS